MMVERVGHVMEFLLGSGGGIGDELNFIALAWVLVLAGFPTPSCECRGNPPIPQECQLITLIYLD